MPELPEVETIVRDLNNKVLGRKIQDIWSDVKKFKVQSLKLKVVGRKIEKIERKGKNILFHLSGGKLLLVHQKMTGHFLCGRWERKKGKWINVEEGFLRDDKMNNFIHLIFWLSDGNMLALSDLRKFAKVAFFDTQKIENIKDIKNLGPDALNVSMADFKKRVLRKNNKDIKQVLMDQETIAGIGNIYADDILWKAAIHPKRKPQFINDNDLKKIFSAMKSILAKSIKKRGTSISDFRDTAGNKGGYGEIRLAYKRKGDPCGRCGVKMERIKIGGRGTCFCPKCQKTGF
jgi:formamidopyrimidine-DNA glycosylase